MDLFHLFEVAQHFRLLGGYYSDTRRYSYLAYEKVVNIYYWDFSLF